MIKLNEDDVELGGHEKKCSLGEQRMASGSDVRADHKTSTGSRSSSSSSSSMGISDSQLTFRSLDLTSNKLSDETESRSLFYESQPTGELLLLSDSESHLDQLDCGCESVDAKNRFACGCCESELCMLLLSVSLSLDGERSQRSVLAGDDANATSKQQTSSHQHGTKRNDKIIHSTDDPGSSITIATTNSTATASNNDHHDINGRAIRCAGAMSRKLPSDRHQNSPNYLKLEQQNNGPNGVVSEQIIKAPSLDHDSRFIFVNGMKMSMEISSPSTNNNNNNNKRAPSLSSSSNISVDSSSIHSNSGYGGGRRRCWSWCSSLSSSSLAFELESLSSGRIESLADAQQSIVRAPTRSSISLPLHSMSQSLKPLSCCSSSLNSNITTNSNNSNSNHQANNNNSNTRASDEDQAHEPGKQLQAAEAQKPRQTSVTNREAESYKIQQKDSTESSSKEVSSFGGDRRSVASSRSAVMIYHTFESVIVTPQASDKNHHQYTTNQLTTDEQLQGNVNAASQREVVQAKVYTEQLATKADADSPVKLSAKLSGQSQTSSSLLPNNTLLADLGQSHPKLTSLWPRWRPFASHLPSTARLRSILRLDRRQLSSPNGQSRASRLSFYMPDSLMRTSSSLDLMLERSVAQVNSYFLDHNLMLGVINNGGLWAKRKLKVPIIYFDTSQCREQVESIVGIYARGNQINGDEDRKNNNGANHNLDYTTTIDMPLTKPNVMALAQSQLAKKIVLRYSQRWISQFDKRKLMFYDDRIKSRHLSTGKCLCQFIEEQLKYNNKDECHHYYYHNQEEFDCEPKQQQQQRTQNAKELISDQHIACTQNGFNYSHIDGGARSSTYKLNGFKQKQNRQQSVEIQEIPKVIHKTNQASVPIPTLSQSVSLRDRSCYFDFRTMRSDPSYENEAHNQVRPQKGYLPTTNNNLHLDLGDMQLGNGCRPPNSPLGSLETPLSSPDLSLEMGGDYISRSDDLVRKLRLLLELRKNELQGIDGSLFSSVLYRAPHNFGFPLGDYQQDMVGSRRDETAAGRHKMDSYQTGADDSDGTSSQSQSQKDAKFFAQREGLFFLGQGAKKSQQDSDKSHHLVGIC